jgi:hypothetical protein
MQRRNVILFHIGGGGIPSAMMNEKNIDRLMYNIANQGETKNTNVIKYTETINV